jgi:hypothetical protein
MSTDDDLDVAHVLIEAISKTLAGHPSRIQGCTLADLLATWLAGHILTSPGDTNVMREQLLQNHLVTVRRLIPINEIMKCGRPSEGEKK